MEKRKMQRIAKNPEQVARFITEDVQRVLAKDILYTKKEFYNLLTPLSAPYKHSVYLVAMWLITLKVIKQHQREYGWRYSLMPDGVLDFAEERKQLLLEQYEETAWIVRFKHQKKNI
jgi:membrane protein YdbS with pleckstrin-like domain